MVTNTLRQYGYAFLLLLISSASLADSWPQQQAYIEDLLGRLAVQPAVFIRNGSEHSAQEAEAHLRMKLNRAIKSWFSPPKEEWTAELFIDKLASKSSLSGKPYQIRFEDGNIVEARTWLYQQLAEIKAQNNSD